MHCRAALSGLLAAALCSLASLQTGCATKAYKNPNAPIFNTGAGATIIMPGQQAPSMPGYGGGGGAGPPGQPQGMAPGGTDMSMLGGAITIDTSEIRKKRDPIWGNPLLWPFAPLLWPARKISEAMNNTEDNRAFRREAEQRIYQQTGVPFPNAHPYGRAQEAQAVHEQAEQQAMEQALRQQQGGGGAPAWTGAPAPGAAPSGSLSIADELEALRNGRAPARASAGDSAASAPPPVSSRFAAIPSGASAADRAEDRDDDGRPETFVGEAAGRKREVVDADGDGRAEKTVYYAPDGEIARVEEDTDGDGQVDSWASYEAGQIARRRADTDGDGEADTWTLYQDGQMARHEQDSDGDGVRDKIELYRGGKLARRSEDADGDGRPERITEFDAKGQPVAVEEDKNGDGAVDVRSHYSAGKLVRREMLDESQAVQ